jgi:sugar phosphate isomerase/epimerase
MKLSVFNPILYDKTLEEAIIYLKKLGVNAMEVGCGGFPGTTHVNARELVKDPSKVEELKALFTKYNMEICALSTHGNALHPNKEIAKEFQADFEATCKLAGLLGVETIITFSGCPGDSDNAKYPNWVTCPWPEDFLQILDYQWDKLVTYWKKATAFAASCGVKKIALEMHPGFCVYNPLTCMKLREAVGDMIGANVDPSHLIWQGIDVPEAIRYLGKAVYHFHAKDTRIDKRNTAISGVLDTRHYSDEINRAWVFRTVGYGSNDTMWKDIFSMLNLIGYNGPVSIEHEDSVMIPTEGLEKAVKYLQGLMIENPKPGTMSWA